MNTQRKIWTFATKQIPAIINEDLNQTKIIHTETHKTPAIYCVYTEHFLPKKKEESTQQKK